MAKETAEQKLLKLIEASSPSSANAQQDVARQMAQAVRGGGLKSLLPGFLRPASGKSFASANVVFGLREFNGILLFAVLVVFAFFAVDFFGGIKSLDTKIDFPIDSNVSKNLSNIIPAVKDLAHYLAPMEARNIFQPIEKKAVEEKPVVAEQTKKISGLVEKLKLVGVSWLDSPETASVMLEDTESGITYFVRQGEKVKELTVKTIYTDRVVLTYEGEEVTIKL